MSKTVPISASPDSLDARPRKFLNTRQASEFLEVFSEQSLHMMRFQGRGPAYVRCGRKVFYRLEDLERWIASNVVTPEEEGKRHD